MSVFQLAVTVHLKTGVLDVQGKAIESALHGLGWRGASEVEVGRVIRLKLEAESLDAAKVQAKAMCDALLANTVIERYDVQAEPL